jgi:hypothetical protein
MEGEYTSTVYSPSIIDGTATGDNVVPSIMEIWRFKYFNVPAGSFVTEQEYIDHTFIWLIYFNFGILLSAEELAVAA